MFFFFFRFRHGHKSTVMDLNWNKNGNWLLTGSRDRLLKVFDIRMMKEMYTFRGHKKEAACKAFFIKLCETFFFLILVFLDSAFSG